MIRPVLASSIACLFLASCTTLSTEENVELSANTTKAKNVILFIGDGMGVSTVTATRIFDGQSRGQTGEEHVLSFEKFPHTALVKTYNTNQQVPDSAGTATAMMTGVKTRAGVINIGPAALKTDCAGAQQHQLQTMGDFAVSKSKRVGIVSTARLTHATPAAVYAHSAERKWETDSDIPLTERGKGCQDIAAQLISFPFDIALGGGRSEFVGSSQNGNRENTNDDLLQAWKNSGGQFVSTARELSSAPNNNQVLGLFSDSHMTYMLDKQADSTEPTLTEMTTAAISHLDNPDQGYFLMVEGGRIDHGHHEGQAGYALTEAQEFAHSVQSAVNNTNPDETLILVTADHSHVFVIAGYPARGNPILGLAKGTNAKGEPTGTPIIAADGQPYTTLGYMNGPGAVRTGNRPAPSTDIKALQQALVPTPDSFGSVSLSETHGGEDVALYATGPGSENVRGVIEQNKIHDIILSATGWSD